MIRSFHDEATLELFRTGRHREFRSIERVAKRKLDQVESAVNVDDLSRPPGNRLERLSGDRAGQWSLRINDQYRVCFRWKDGDAEDVEVVDYH